MNQNTEKKQYCPIGYMTMPVSKYNRGSTDRKATWQCLYQNTTEVLLSNKPHDNACIKIQQRSYCPINHMTMHVSKYNTGPTDRKAIWQCLYQNTTEVLLTEKPHDNACIKIQQRFCLYQTEILLTDKPHDTACIKIQQRSYWSRSHMTMHVSKYNRGPTVQ